MNSEHREGDKQDEPHRNEETERDQEEIAPPVQATEDEVEVNDEQQASPPEEEEEKKGDGASSLDNNNNQTTEEEKESTDESSQQQQRQQDESSLAADDKRKEDNNANHARKGGNSGGGHSASPEPGSPAGSPKSPMSPQQKKVHEEKKRRQFVGGGFWVHASMSLTNKEASEKEIEAARFRHERALSEIKKDHHLTSHGLPILHCANNVQKAGNSNKMQRLIFSKKVDDENMLMVERLYGVKPIVASARTCAESEKNRKKYVKLHERVKRPPGGRLPPVMSDDERLDREAYWNDDVRVPPRPIVGGGGNTMYEDGDEGGGVRDEAHGGGGYEVVPPQPTPPTGDTPAKSNKSRRPHTDTDSERSTSSSTPQKKSKARKKPGEGKNESPAAQKKDSDFEVPRNSVQRQRRQEQRDKEREDHPPGQADKSARPWHEEPVLAPPPAQPKPIPRPPTLAEALQGVPRGAKRFGPRLAPLKNKDGSPVKSRIHDPPPAPPSGAKKRKKKNDRKKKDGEQEDEQLEGPNRDLRPYGGGGPEENMPKGMSPKKKTPQEKEPSEEPTDSGAEEPSNQDEEPSKKKDKSPREKKKTPTPPPPAGGEAHQRSPPYACAECGKEILSEDDAVHFPHEGEELSVHRLDCEPLWKDVNQPKCFHCHKRIVGGKRHRVELDGHTFHDKCLDKLPSCKQCGKKITGEYVELADNDTGVTAELHDDCVEAYKLGTAPPCFVCGKAVLGGSGDDGCEVGDKIFHNACYDSLDKCRACNDAIFEDKVTIEEGDKAPAHFHKQCHESLQFCHHCGKFIVGEFIEVKRPDSDEEAALLHEECVEQYRKSHAPKCTWCAEPILEEGVTIGEEPYHEKCADEYDAAGTAEDKQNAPGDTAAPDGSEPKDGDEDEHAKPENEAGPDEKSPAKDLPLPLDAEDLGEKENPSDPQQELSSPNLLTPASPKPAFVGDCTWCKDPIYETDDYAEGDEGLLLHERCTEPYQDSLAPKCSHCEKPIREEKYTELKSGSAGETVDLHDDCVDAYNAAHRPNCTKCGEIVMDVEGVMTLNGQPYHAQCAKEEVEKEKEEEDDDEEEK